MAQPPAVPSTVRFRTTATGSVEAVPVRADVEEEEELTPADAVLPPLPSPRTRFRKRYGVVYNTQGPKVRMGMAWALVVAASLGISSLRPYGVAVVFGVVAGVASLQVVDAWHRDRTGSDRWVAALGASSLPVLATLGVSWLGGALLVLVVAAVVTAARQDDDIATVSAAGHTVLSAAVCGMAAASLVLLADYEIGAVIILLVYLLVYDATDYAMGSGASNGIEGPAYGVVSIVGLTILFAVLKVPPFRGTDIWNFAVLAAIACPAGQLLASAMLPKADAFAPALRRLDSLLILAPAWAGLVGLYLQRVSG